MNELNREKGVHFSSVLFGVLNGQQHQKEKFFFVMKNEVVVARYQKISRGIFTLAVFTSQGIKTTVSNMMT